MNALNASNKLAKEGQKSVSELIRMGMYKSEALECYDSIVSYSYVSQELWPSKNNLVKQDYHHTQIPSEIETCDGFAMDYHVALFFQSEDMIIPKEEILISITKRMNKIRIFLGDHISDSNSIMCTHGGKQWSRRAKIHLKNIQKKDISMFQGLRPFIIRFPDNKLHRGKICKSYDTIAPSEMLSVKITTHSIKDETWYNKFDEVVNEGFHRGHNLEITHIRKGESHNFAWIVGPSPEQIVNIRKKIIFEHKSIDITIGKPSGYDLAKKMHSSSLQKN